MTLNPGLPHGLKASPYRATVSPEFRSDQAGSVITLPDPVITPWSRAKLTAAVTVKFPPAVAGQVIDLALEQGGSGGYTATWDSQVAWPRSTAPSLSTQVGQVDYFRFMCTRDGTWDGTTTSLNDSGYVTAFSLGDGAIATNTVYAQRFVQYVRSIEILGVSASFGFGNGPVGSSAILDLGTGSSYSTLWGTNPGNRPTVADGAQEVVAETLPDTTIINAGVSLRAKCVQAGATTPGSFCVLNVRWRWA